MTSHETGYAAERAVLRHHGDVDATPGLVDFAVNVRADRPPRWLRDRLAAALDALGSYPSAELDARARQAVADRHHRHPDHVVILNGAAEGFALLPVLRPRLAAVVHPGFTEPEVALADAGVPVHRVLLAAEDGYALRPELVPADADLVVIGNPTNPTSVLHPAEVLRGLARPGRVLVVDEAFADAVPGEPESLAAAADVPGLLVLRSLTKTWALPGLRAGYALGDPALLARLTRHRPPWPVGTLTLEAVLACSQPAALAHAAELADQAVAHRAELLAALATVPGLRVEAAPRGPFVLLRVPDGELVRAELRRRGMAVRRADTFPGLTRDHLRVAVRPPEVAGPLVAALAEVCAEVCAQLRPGVAARVEVRG
ncbi:Rv2231c family pyridoxal phosphate-dependent protein CobC [Goodfellowiella coeruleoviolacea]|uniref:Aminotransferase n=1 Tax=Goodfellowiella coeruleoviolacea TaxID=334858 RepID=A0AAE3GH67_9PSEU|nr:Rv2231c family pyridoxal phosphate-dependent protein CobC [Goodfellowiella coeruleoviolacea]MCP2168161.1 L-threonine O-3-phosphate decarboxylase (EC 4.1.1.81) [Goodfellowiella coeruleoviolacea]